ncbi:MAG: 3-methyladenine DNA glycosylase [Caedibacter sp. 38-128]|nr:DNA-3-methyladenine glycosylase [Holosporales bacterium]OJX07230.1 MAG: 3-methyladenine DNA glycosylase [Caedibacter sp. 38-128]
MTRLTKDYFSQPTLEVAKDLLGKELIFRDYRGLITETEAYIGRDDPACHAARGKTPRTTVMFGPAGVSYVYFIYGMYFCLNIVTEAEGFPAAVLIRGLHLLQPESKNLNGPGKLCKHLGITREHNGLDLTMSDVFYVQDKGVKPGYIATPRIGIKVGTEKLWRFIITEDFSTIHG